MVRPKLKGALIAANEQVRGRLKDYLVIADELDIGWETRLFDSLAEAQRWLEGPP